MAHEKDDRSNLSARKAGDSSSDDTNRRMPGVGVA